MNFYVFKFYVSFAKVISINKNLKTISNNNDWLFQLVVTEVANKFAQSHFVRGVRENKVRLLTVIIMDYVQVLN